MFGEHNSFYFFLCSIFFSVLIIGCSTTKRLQPGEQVLRSAKIRLNSEQGMLTGKGELQEQLQSAIVQKPNTYLLGIPYKVGLYNLRYKKYQADSNHFQFRTKVVEAPVVLDTSLVERSKQNMLNLLTNKGYFYADVSYEIVLQNKKKARVYYDIVTGKQYFIRELFFECADTAIKATVQEIAAQGSLQTNRPYSNTSASEERSRIVQEMQNRGYYNFNIQNIVFELDTLQDDNTQSYTKSIFEEAISPVWSSKSQLWLNVKTTVLESVASNDFKKYKIGKVMVYPDNSVVENNSNGVLFSDTYNNIELHYLKKYVNTGVLDKKIFLRPGEYYSLANYNQTIRQLNDLGIFQFVRVVLQPNETNNELDAVITLQAHPKYEFNTSVEVSGGDLYVIGTAANISVTDKNFLKGANQLTTTVSYGIELGQNKNLAAPFLQQLYLFSENRGLNFRLAFPKFLLPVNQNLFSRRSLPRTVMDVGFNVLRRSDYFTLESFNASLGYLWKESQTKSWIVRPVFFNLLNLSNISSTFRERMDSIPAIRNSFQETFIEGESIEYIYNTEGKSRHRYSLLKIGVEEAGLLMSGINSLYVSLANNKQSINYARYFRFDFDARQYFINRHSMWAFRMYGGLGLPYGGSSVLPYIKQYFVGGAYSIRGWRPRALGPGSYYDDAKQSSIDNLFIDQAGDIKLEINSEYRFSMINLFAGAISINGAVFADAGNIWLMKKDPQMIGAELNFNRFYQDFAISSGAGLRLDLGGFLVVRLDWGVPLKKPYVKDNYGWVFQEINFKNAKWRKENINMNIAIGYPF